MTVSSNYLLTGQSLELDTSILRSSLRKPLRPVWISPDFLDDPTSSLQGVFNTIVCCSASRRVLGAEASEEGYIQGAGDDSEGWAHGLSPPVFWTHYEELLAAGEHDLPTLIKQSIVTEQEKALLRIDGTQILSTSVFIGTTDAVKNPPSLDGIIVCDRSSTHEASPMEPNVASDTHVKPKMLYLDCGSGKLGSRALRKQLSLVIPFVLLIARSKSQPQILITCATGKDISVGVALTVLCLFYDVECESCHDQSSPKRVQSIRTGE